MASENNGSLTVAAIPAWIEASLFKPVLMEILDDYKQTKDFRVKPAVGGSENYSTVILRIEADVELRDGSIKVISLLMKIPPDGEMFRKMLQGHNIFEVEAIMYREIIPEFEQLYRDVGVHINFGAKSYELSTDRFFILLEDLTPRGFKNVNRIEGLDMEHTQAMLKKLAQWHAASAVRVATKGPYKSIIADSMFREGSIEILRVFYQGLADTFLECAKTYEGCELYYEQLNKKKDTRIDELFEAARKVDLNEFNVLNHGDCWANNVMFRHDAFGNIEDTYLVDYQFPKYGSPALDLYFFLLSSPKYELKIKHFDYFIKYYHDQLTEHLKLLNYSKTVPALNDIHIALHKYNHWALTASTDVLGPILVDTHADANLENFLKDSDDATDFKMHMFSNPRFRKHIAMLLPWLHNRGAI